MGKKLVYMGKIFIFLFVLFLFLFFCRPHLWHMEVPRLGVESEL